VARPAGQQRIRRPGGARCARIDDGGKGDMVQFAKQPWLGVVAWGAAFFSQPVGHTVYALIRATGGALQYATAFLLGIAALWLIGRALRRDELAASLAGFAGGWLLWSTWASFGFLVTAEAFGIPPVEFGMGITLPPDATLLMATGPLLPMLFVVYGLFNRETRCNLMRFLMRHGRASPGMPSGGAQRSFARIVAMETLFIIWSLYIFWLYVMWFLIESPLFYVVFAAYVVWSVYLMSRLLKVPRAAHALRYGIPTGIISWSLAEMPAHWGLYREVWLRPFEYPLVCALLATVFVGSLLLLARSAPRVGARPASQAA
jgi:hypothetical protein